SQFVVKELMRGREKIPMVLDLLPIESQEQLLSLITLRIKKNPKKSIKNIMKGIVPERFLDYILKVNQDDENQKVANTTKETIHKLVQHIKNFTFHVNGSLPMEKAFVTGG